MQIRIILPQTYYQKILLGIIIIRKATIKKKENNNCLTRTERSWSPCTLVGGNVKWYRHCGKQYRISQKIKAELQYISSKKIKKNKKK